MYVSLHGASEFYFEKRCLHDLKGENFIAMLTGMQIYVLQNFFCLHISPVR